jgi:hypothetical protein
MIPACEEFDFLQGPGDLLIPVDFSFDCQGPRIIVQPFAGRPACTMSRRFPRQKYR